MKKYNHISQHIRVCLWNLHHIHAFLLQSHGTSVLLMWPLRGFEFETPDLMRHLFMLTPKLEFRLCLEHETDETGNRCHETGLMQ
jgi:hypothetical protein